MNKKIIIFIVILTVVIAGFFSAVEHASYKPVFVNFKQSNLSINMYTNNNKKITSLSESSTIKLKEGSYYYIPTTKLFDSEKVYFLAKNGDTVDINPAYSPTKLQSLLELSRSDIQSVLVTTYPLILTDYLISDEQLYNHGLWYSAKLIERPLGADEPDIYRVILQKDNNNWKIVVSPRLVISSKDFPHIPKGYINSVNELPSSGAYSQLYSD